MKLVVQIPAYNEQDNILKVLEEIPKKIEGINEIKIVVLDDCSSDNTNKIASDFGVEVLKNPQNKGLAYTFLRGVDFSLSQNADIMVNIDGDNQYDAKDIEKLIKPILNKEANMTIGTRPIGKIKTFSPLKKFLQKLGSKTVEFLSDTKVEDAASGYRAFDRLSLLKLNIFNPFTYTIESIMQAKAKNLVSVNVDINVNPQENRKSKLFKSSFQYILKQAKNIIRFFIAYKPVKFFCLISLVLFIFGLITGTGFLYTYFSEDYIKTVLLFITSSGLIILSLISLGLASLSDLISINRKLLESIQFEQRQKKYKN